MPAGKEVGDLTPGGWDDVTANSAEASGALSDELSSSGTAPVDNSAAANSRRGGDPTGDADGDGKPNIVDPTPDGDTASKVRNASPRGDADADGIPNEDDPTPTSSSGGGRGDIDGDGIPDSRDSDIDGDGTPNSRDSDVDGDGTPNSRDSDVDGDGKPNSRDSDVDGDGKPNSRDSDVDGDGTPNSRDSDIDGDGKPNTRDSDMDGDGKPNSRDSDVDGDGTPNVADSTPAGAGTRQASLARDEILGHRPAAPTGPLIGKPTASDSDGDGTPDTQDGTPDGDAGGVPDSEAASTFTPPAGTASLYSELKRNELAEALMKHGSVHEYLAVWKVADDLIRSDNPGKNEDKAAAALLKQVSMDGMDAQLKDMKKLYNKDLSPNREGRYLAVLQKGEAYQALIAEGKSPKVAMKAVLEGRVEIGGIDPAKAKLLKTLRDALKTHGDENGMRGTDELQKVKAKGVEAAKKALNATKGALGAASAVGGTAQESTALFFERAETLLRGHRQLETQFDKRVAADGKFSEDDAKYLLGKAGDNLETANEMILTGETSLEEAKKADDAGSTEETQKLVTEVEKALKKARTAFKAAEASLAKLEKKAPFGSQVRRICGELMKKLKDAEENGTPADVAAVLKEYQKVASRLRGGAADRIEALGEGAVKEGKEGSVTDSFEEQVRSKEEYIEKIKGAIAGQAKDLTKMKRDLKAAEKKGMDTTELKATVEAFQKQLTAARGIRDDEKKALTPLRKALKEERKKEAAAAAAAGETPAGETPAATTGDPPAADPPAAPDTRSPKQQLLALRRELAKNTKDGGRLTQKEGEDAVNAVLKVRDNLKLELTEANKKPEAERTKAEKAAIKKLEGALEQADTDLTAARDAKRKAKKDEAPKAGETTSTPPASDKSAGERLIEARAKLKKDTKDGGKLTATEAAKAVREIESIITELESDLVKACTTHDAAAEKKLRAQLKSAATDLSNAKAAKENAIADGGATPTAEVPAAIGGGDTDGKADTPAAPATRTSANSDSATFRTKLSELRKEFKDNKNDGGRLTAKEGEDAAKKLATVIEHLEAAKAKAVAADDPAKKALALDLGKAKADLGRVNAATDAAVAAETPTAPPETPAAPPETPAAPPETPATPEADKTNRDKLNDARSKFREDVADGGRFTVNEGESAVNKLNAIKVDIETDVAAAGDDEAAKKRAKADLAKVNADLRVVNAALDEARTKAGATADATPDATAPPASTNGASSPDPDPNGDDYEEYMGVPIKTGGGEATYLMNVPSTVTVREGGGVTVRALPIEHDFSNEKAVIKTLKPNVLGVPKGPKMTGSPKRKRGRPPFERTDEIRLARAAKKANGKKK